MQKFRRKVYLMILWGRDWASCRNYTGSKTGYYRKALSRQYSEQVGLEVGLHVVDERSQYYLYTTTTTNTTTTTTAMTTTTTTTTTKQIQQQQQKYHYWLNFDQTIELGFCVQQQQQNYKQQQPQQTQQPQQPYQQQPKKKYNHNNTTNFLWSISWFCEFGQ